jgi:hypothetical protein
MEAAYTIERIDNIALIDTAQKERDRKYEYSTRVGEIVKFWEK